MAEPAGEEGVVTLEGLEAVTDPGDANSERNVLSKACLKAGKMATVAKWWKRMVNVQTLFCHFDASADVPDPTFLAEHPRFFGFSADLSSFNFAQGPEGRSTIAKDTATKHLNLFVVTTTCAFTKPTKYKDIYLPIQQRISPPQN